MAKQINESMKHLDVITIGRASVDLYGQQIGTRLEDVTSFAKSVGGCPANIAIGTARLGLKSALVTRVGNDQMGRFIVEQLCREGVETKGMIVDDKHLTALAILGIKNDHEFPLLFYRDHCADMALNIDDISEEFILRSRSILVSGTHFSKPNVELAQKKAIEIAKKHNIKVIFDIDYRPNLWGLAGLSAGEERYIASSDVSKKLMDILQYCDLIIGTEEEILIASGESELLPALKTMRALSSAVIVLKRGPMGCIVYDGAIGDQLEQGIIGKGFPIEVYNVLGAGDSFMSGFLAGWLRDEPLATCATYANACGAFAVSRLLCSPEIPTYQELQYFLENGSQFKALRQDNALNHIHWATTRHHDIPLLMALAIDHRSQLVEIADELNVSYDKISDFKRLTVKAAAKVANGRAGYGMLIDERFGKKAFFDAREQGFTWLGRPVELPGSNPLRFEFSQDIGSQLVEWPKDHCIKCLCFYHPDDDNALKVEQQEKLRSLFDAARKIGRELLVEIIASKNGAVDDQTIARAIEELYQLGIKPDWWKLEPQSSAQAWQNINDVIMRHDPLCRGVVLLGLEAEEDVLEQAFIASRAAPLVKGFAVGRTIFNAPAKAWLAGEIDDEAAISLMAGNFERLTAAWLKSRNIVNH